jgi:hypothetical protein
MSRNICEVQKGRSIWLPSVCGMPCLGEDFRLLVAGNEKRERERERERERNRRSCRGDRRFLRHYCFVFIFILFVGLTNFARLRPERSDSLGLAPGRATDCGVL